MKHNLTKLYIFLALFAICTVQINAQNIAITDDDGYSADPVAMLDVYSLSKGLLLPRVALVTTTNPISGTKPDGLLVWNTSTSGTYDSPGYYFWNGSDWEKVGTSTVFSNGLNQIGDAVKWGGSLTENTTITQGDNYVRFDLSGTGNFNIRDEGSSAFFVKNDGNVGINNASPLEKLDIDGNLMVRGNILMGDNVMVEGFPDFRIYRNLASYDGGGSDNGYLVVNTQMPGGTAAMFSITIEGYFYSNSTGDEGHYEMTVNAYFNGSSFANTGYVSVSPFEFPVNLGRNASGNVAVILGDGSSFSWPHLTVTTFRHGYSGIDESKADDWTITNEADLSGMLSYQPVSNTTKLSNYYSATDVDGLISATDFFNKAGSLISTESVDDNLSLGTESEAGKLLIQGTNADLNTSIFEVKNKDGQTVFAVYPEGVRVYVNDDPQSKATGNRGGFAVGGFGTSKGITDEYFVVSRDSTRIYYDPAAGKASGNRGGFAVGGFGTSKATPTNFLDLSVENYFIGHESGISTTTGQYNTAFGYQAGRANSSGNYNVFIGYLTGLNNTTGHANTFVGSESGKNNINGGYNSFVGYKSGFSNESARYNTMMGYMSGYYNKIGEYNTYIGFQSGYESGVTAGNEAEYNSFIGFQSGYNNRNGDRNIFMGYKSGFTNDDASYNIFIGNESGYYTTDGDNNLFLGYRAGYRNQVGEFNTYIGYQSGFYGGYSTADPSYNTFVGYQTGYNNRTGSYNTFLGFNAGYGIYSTAAGGDKNVMIGYYSGRVNIADNNTFIGTESGYNNDEGEKNVFLGFRAGYSNTDGNKNIFIGNNAGYTNTTGDRVICIGDSAGSHNTAGNNIFIGAGAGRANTSGGTNIFIGNDAGALNTTGAGNTYVGWGAALNNDGDNNVMIGYWAGLFANNTSRNIYVGQGAGLTNTGNDNIFMGYLTGNGSGDNCIYIGNQLDRSGDNKLIIEGLGDDATPLISGDFNTNDIAFYGDVGIDSQTPENELYINSTSDASFTNGSGAFQIGTQTGTNLLMDNNEIMARSNGGSSTLYLQWSGGNLYVGTGTHYYYGSWNQGSDRRLKKDIKNLEYGLNEILKLRPVDYYWKKGDNNKRSIGLIAQEVEPIIDELVAISDDEENEEEIMSVNYIGLVPVLINAMQEQQKQIEDLKKQLGTKNTEYENLKTQNQEILKQLSEIRATLNLETKK